MLSSLSQTSQVTIVFSVILVAYVAAYRLLKFGNPLSMLFAALIGGLVSDFGLLDLARHLVEGSFTFLNIVLIIYTATVFIYVQKLSGGLDAIVRDLILYFHAKPKILVVFLMFLIMLPPAFTGPGADGIFAFGAVVSSILLAMGLPLVKVTAFIALGGTLGVFAPPVNIPAMIIAAGINMPYVGFVIPLVFVTIPLAVFCALALSLKHISGPVDVDAMLKNLPPIPTRMKGIRVYLPLIAVIGLMLSGRAMPHYVPHMGVPLVFVIGTFIALFLGGRINFLKASQVAFHDTFPINSILMAVGALVQIMSLTGVRGLFVLSAITAPSFFLYLAIFIGFPLFAGIFTSFGAASVFGIPFMLALLGRDPIIATIGLSAISIVGNLMPPTAALGKPAAIVAGYRDAYLNVVKVSAVPLLAILVAGICLVIFADAFRFIRL
ncbi:MAG: TRAP transporter large permease [Deltaproteobacteria bacterium]|nr:TRAP transporter large permease [Deltaproteobacteria bacterium]